MAKLSNIIEKNRSSWTTAFFVFKESFKGAKKWSAYRLISQVFWAIFSFMEFGAVAMIVNEFSLNGIQGANPNVLISGFLLLLASHFLPELIGSFNNIIDNTWNNEISRHLTQTQFNKMGDLDIGTIEQPELQNMIETVNSRSWSAFFATFFMVTNSIRHVIAVIIATVSLVIISPWALLIIGLGVLPTFIFNKKDASLSNQIWDEHREVARAWRAKTDALYEKLMIIELKNFNLVNIFSKKWTLLILAYHNAVYKLRRKKLGLDVLSAVILSIAFGIAFAILIRQVSVGAIALGSLVFSVGVVSRFQSGMNQLFSNAAKIGEHARAINTFMDLLEMEPLVVSGTRDIVPAEFKTLEIKNVSFAYPGAEKSVLEHITLTINHTDSLAIVGLNGAGKTTLIKLLTRVYDPTKGEILVNDVNLKDYDLKAWKKCLGILLQDYSIYSEETIAENIMLGDTSKHDQGLVQSAATETTADEYIQELPEKYQQRVGTEFRGGVELSKGQKQKLALARVLYRNAPIVILDEPTAAIDALSEDTIFKALRNNHKNQTRIIISHKFSNVRDADKIILIEHGKIIEQGSHDELMTIGQGKYKELFELQAEGYQTKPKRVSRKKKSDGE